LRTERHVRIALRYAPVDVALAGLGRFGAATPQRLQRYLSRRFAAPRASVHQWFVQNSVLHRSLHQVRRRGGSAAPHHAHPPACERVSEQFASSAALLNGAALTAAG